MYCNPNNIVNTIIKIIEKDKESINVVIKRYEGSKHNGLTIYKGLQKTLPNGAFPSLEIEPGDASNEWFATRTQMAQFPMTLTLTMIISKKEYEIEYRDVLVTRLVDILTDPKNLQMPIDNEFIIDNNYGKLQAYMMDSFVENVSYASAKEGTVRIATLSWWCKVLQQYPEDRWKARDGSLLDV